LTADPFAFGLALYEFFQGTSPYEEISSDGVQTLYTQKVFPDVSGIPCGQKINNVSYPKSNRTAHVQTAVGDIRFRTVDVDSLFS
jgi:hypothetical protein